MRQKEGKMKLQLLKHLSKDSSSIIFSHLFNLSCYIGQAINHIQLISQLLTTTQGTKHKIR